MSASVVTPEIVEQARQLREPTENSKGLSIRAAAEQLGVKESSLRYHLNGKQRASGKAGVAVQPSHIAEAGVETGDDPDTATLTEPPNVGPHNRESLMAKHGFDPAEWHVETARLSSWTGPGPDGTIREYGQLRLNVRRKISFAILIPATHVPELVKPAPAKFAVDQPTFVIVEADHQAPYQDPALDAATTAFHAAHQPDIQVFAGDLIDLPTISRFTDHPAALSTVQEGLVAGYHVLRRRREAAPHAKAFKLKGNHDWRLEQEVLRRAERLHAIMPVGEDVAALSLRRLLQLDALEIEFVEHPLGWEHAEIELVEGRDGLVVRHGFITGANTAGRTLDKLGRSAIVFHNHDKEHVWKLDYPEKIIRQALVGGAMCRNDDVFPHFAVEPNWHQGFVTATIWPDGQFQLEHALWNGSELFWRDERIKP